MKYRSCGIWAVTRTSRCRPGTRRHKQACSIRLLVHGRPQCSEVVRPRYPCPCGRWLQGRSADDPGAPRIALAGKAYTPYGNRGDRRQRSSHGIPGKAVVRSRAARRTRPVHQALLPRDTGAKFLHAAEWRAAISVHSRLSRVRKTRCRGTLRLALADVSSNFFTRGRRIVEMHGKA